MKLSPLAVSPRAGAALVIVLLMIVLLTLLVLSYFVDVRTESVAAGNYSERGRVKMLADSAENLAIGQIQKATEGQDQGGNLLAWASQPGMIRTWDSSGQPVKAYKLYTSDKMVVDGNFGSAADLAADVPAGWKGSPAEFTDLNSPVLVQDSAGPISQDGTTYSAHFPIISGNHLVAGTYAGKGVQTYPPNMAIEGFGIDENTPGGVGQVGDGAIRPDNNPVPMPVRWLYILQDGTLAPISGNKVTGATNDNPIVGRIAFWTDDDTCRLNVNTASEGTFWDRPYTTSLSERNLSSNIPAQNEFQAFPGHPATTALSPVLGAIFPVPDWVTSSNYSQLIPYYNLIPRVTDGGSKGGTTRASGSGSIVKYDADRLYASVDEFMFKANDAGGERQKNNPLITNDFLEEARFFLTAHSRAPEVNLFNRPRISLWPLDPNVQNAKDKLLGYCSTINNKPYYFQRTVVTGTSSAASAFENTSQSPTADWSKYPRNKQLYNYLQTLTSAPIPGLGGRLDQKYPGNQRNQILTEMVDYLRSGVNIASTDIDPKYNFAPPRGVAGEGQVIPLTLASNGSAGSDTRGFGRFLTISEGALILYHTGKYNATTKQIDSNNIQAVFVLEPFCPSPGLPSWSPNCRIRVTNLSGFKVDGKSLNLPPQATLTCDAFENSNFDANSTGTWPVGSTAFPATRLFFYYNDNGTPAPKTVKYMEGEARRTIYPFVSSAPVTLDFSANDTSDTSDKHTVSLAGAPVKVEVLGPAGSGDTPIQTLVLDFSKGTTNGRSTQGGELASIPPPEPDPNIKNTNSTTWLSDFNHRIPRITTANNIKNTLIAREASSANLSNDLGKTNKEFNRRGDVVRSVEARAGQPLYGDLRALSLIFKDDNSDLFARHAFYGAYGLTPPVTDIPAFDPFESADAAQYNYRFAEGLRSDEDGGTNSGTNGVFDGQFSNYFAKSPGHFKLLSPDQHRKGTFLTAGGLLKLSGDQYIQRDAPPSVPFATNGAYLGRLAKNGTYVFGDWDTGVGINGDGPYINFPDEGNSAIRTASGFLAGHNTDLYGEYFGRGEYTKATDDTSATYSPNRQISSAVAFGSLSAGVDPANPASVQDAAWRTLLFCANPAAGAVHPGFGTPTAGTNPYPPYSSPPDHAFLDLFTMPIVEGYPISEPMSTAGKVNMNYQIAPFTYIHRSTAIRGVLKHVVLAAIPTTTLVRFSSDADAHYGQTKVFGSGGGGWGGQIRYGVNLAEDTGTLRQFERRFEKGDLFRSATEICDMFLVPRQISGISPSDYTQGPGLPTGGFSSSGDIDFANNPISKWWSPPSGWSYSAADYSKAFATGDNLRETPYNHIYPRLTTKSNSYTVYVRVQSLKKNPNTGEATFIDPSSGAGLTDQVTGEYRGSFEIERYLDPNEMEKTGVDFATAGLADANANVSKYYKFRTITAKEFRP